VLGPLWPPVGLPAPARYPRSVDHSERCTRILSLSLPQATIQSAEIIRAGPFTLVPPGGLDPVVVQLHEHIRVKLVVEPQINIEIWLPSEHWNGRFQGVGGGGLAGIISYAALATGLQNGYATASTDTGHIGRRSAAARQTEDFARLCFLYPEWVIAAVAAVQTPSTASPPWSTGSSAAWRRSGSWPRRS
jgi:hypothetical protein